MSMDPNQIGDEWVREVRYPDFHPHPLRQHSQVRSNPLNARDIEALKTEQRGLPIFDHMTARDHPRTDADPAPEHTDAPRQWLSDASRGLVLVAAVFLTLACLFMASSVAVGVLALRLMGVDI